MITVFTPTYNRLNTLPRLYKSLLSQNVSDFEWLIIDDGSTDDTTTLVNSFKSEKFAIRYYKQENAGKHIAINTGANLAKGEIFLILDSDDMLTNDAVQTILNKFEEVRNDNLICRISFLSADFKKRIFLKGPHFDKLRMSYFEFRIIKGYDGDICDVIKTDILKAHPFPVFPNEKFCRESLLFNRLSIHYKAIFIYKIITLGDYLDDGLSVNSWERIKKSPRYGMVLYRELLQFAKDKEKRMEFAKNYWDIALSAKQIPFREKLSGIPLSLTLKVFGKKFLKKIKIG